MPFRADGRLHCKLTRAPSAPVTEQAGRSCQEEADPKTSRPSITAVFRAVWGPSHARCITSSPAANSAKRAPTSHNRVRSGLRGRGPKLAHGVNKVKRTAAANSIISAGISFAPM